MHKELKRTLKGFEYDKLLNCGFNVAYAKRCLGVPPDQGTLERDMVYTQTAVEARVYQRMCKEGWDHHWLKGFLEEFSEDACMERFRQNNAFKRLDDLVRDNDGVWLLSDEE